MDHCPPLLTAFDNWLLINHSSLGDPGSNGYSHNITQRKDACHLTTVKLDLLTLMLRTYYYFIATYFYLDLVGGIVPSTSFDQFFDWFLSGVWWLWVVSWSHLWSCMIYHHDVWQLYTLAKFLNNPAGDLKKHMQTIAKSWAICWEEPPKICFAKAPECQY